MSTTTSASSPLPVLQARGLVKRYGNVTALDGCDFEVLPGEILAVIGDNGAGKSSLIKALSGATVPDEGEILLDGKPVKFRSPLDARAQGIETVYQELAVAPAMSIAENLFLARELVKPGWRGSIFKMIDKRRMLEEATAHMKDLQIGIRSMRQAVETLSGGQRQGVAVARSAAFARHVVILDEPTAALGVKQSFNVLKLIHKARAKGISVIFITHNVHHAYPIGDSFTLLNRGKSLGTFTKETISKDEVLDMMAGGAEMQKMIGELEGATI